MEYISTREAAAKWGVTLRYVQRLLHENRIPGAKKYSGAWLIPAKSEKPVDPRRARGEKTERPFFTLPRHCPLLIMTTLYARPGSGDAVADALTADPEAQMLFRAGLTYLRGDLDGAALLTQELAFEEKRPDLFIAFATLRCVLALYRGDTAAWLAAKERLANMTCLTEEERVQRDFALGHVLIGLYDIGGFPPWFAQGDFESLPEDCYPFARFVYLKYLGIKNQSNAAALPARPLVAQCHADGALVAELYCRLLVAIGYLELGELSTAAQEIDRAIALALPDRLCAPLAEYRDNLGTLLDERLALVDREMLRAVKALNQQIREGWTALNRDLRGLVNTVNLTQQERQVAKLAAQGLSNAEIAARMHIKVNTVKGHVSEAISKTGAHSRSELAKFIGMEAPSE